MQIAIKNYDEAISLIPNESCFYCNRGKANFQLGNIKTAINNYNHALSLEPNNIHAKINFNIARSQLKQKKRKKNSKNNNCTDDLSTKIHKKNVNALDLDAIYKNIGKTVRLKGKIINTIVDSKYKYIYLKFAEDIFNSVYAYIPKKKFNMFPNASSLTGKDVIITGRISLNRRKRPVIVINQPSQIREVQ